MFIVYTRRGHAGTAQWSAGSFLAIFNKDSGGELRGCVKSVRLRQLGQWMMGEMWVRGIRVGLSGTYGSDGLPIDSEKLTQEAWDQLVVLPTELTDAFWRGGGHNSAGEEGPAMRVWARKNLAALRKAATKPRTVK